jgi:DNA-binding ferritin-like protein (Dps family)
MGISSEFKNFTRILDDIIEDLTYEKSKIENDIDGINKYWNGIAGNSVKLLLDDLRNDYNSIEKDLEMIKTHLKNNIKVFKNVRELYETREREEAEGLDKVVAAWNDWIIDKYENVIEVPEEYYEGFSIYCKD